MPSRPHVIGGRDLLLLASADLAAASPLSRQPRLEDGLLVLHEHVACEQDAWAATGLAATENPLGAALP